MTHSLSNFCVVVIIIFSVLASVQKIKKIEYYSSEGIEKASYKQSVFLVNLLVRVVF